jgi:hypothetical protein
MTDTPQGYGNAEAVYFNGDTGGIFVSDGTFVNQAGVVLNGTVFTVGSAAGSARAITLSGGSGRVNQYYASGTQWLEKH